MPPLCELGSLLEPNVRIYCFKFLKLARPIIADPLILRTNFCLLFSKIPLGPLGSKGLTLVLVLVQKVFHPVVQCCCWLVCCGEERRHRRRLQGAGQCRPGHHHCTHWPPLCTDWTNTTSFIQWYLNITWAFQSSDIQIFCSVCLKGEEMNPALLHLTPLCSGSIETQEQCDIIIV